MARHGGRIICIGNRYVPADDIGPRVHDRLLGRDLPADVAVIDGGLSGLNLLGMVDGAERVIFVDALQGFAPAGRPVVLPHRDALAERPAVYGHDGGLAYLLRMLPAVSEGDLPEIAIVGCQPPAGEDVIDELAELSLWLAAGGKAPAGAPAPAGEMEFPR